ncbi:hypothetical protein GOP47_0024078 [Adiantum capillus-veneris]|uniref:Uncharacterized protein n=1 Tax=Adiantum capillus-veneris TaxID=13818 RepID=A0A9D4U4Y7_ADICA|nr:hypothetical protein GOP47_0024078 [Adiantum capillus-veneris]
MLFSLFLSYLYNHYNFSSAVYSSMLYHSLCTYLFYLNNIVVEHKFSTRGWTMMVQLVLVDTERSQQVPDIKQDDGIRLWQAKWVFKVGRAQRPLFGDSPSGCIRLKVKRIGTSLCFIEDRTYRVEEAMIIKAKFLFFLRRIRADGCMRVQGGQAQENFSRLLIYLKKRSAVVCSQRARRGKEAPLWPCMER